MAKRRGFLARGRRVRVRAHNPVRRRRGARRGGFLSRGRRTQRTNPKAPSRRRFTYQPIRARSVRRNPTGLMGRPEVRYAAFAVGGAVAGSWVNAKAASDPEWAMGLGRRSAEWGVQPATVAGALGAAIAWFFLRGRRWRGELLAASIGLMVPEATSRVLGLAQDDVGGAPAALRRGPTAPRRVSAAEIRARIQARTTPQPAPRAAANAKPF